MPIRKPFLVLFCLPIVLFSICSCSTQSRSNGGVQSDKAEVERAVNATLTSVAQSQNTAGGSAVSASRPTRTAPSLTPSQAFVASASVTQSTAIQPTETKAKPKNTSAPFLEGTNPTSGGKIVFFKDGTLYTVSADGTGLSKKNVEVGQSHRSDTTWSPDGKQIAFWSDEGGEIGLAVCIMQTDGSGERKILRIPTQDHGQDMYPPTWSPDGRQLAVSSDPNNDGGDIFVINVDGSGLKNLSNTPPGSDELPAWSPDSKQIAFTTSEPQGSENAADVRVVNRDGSGLRNLTQHFSPLAKNSSSAFGFPVWSPDGRRIVFLANSDLEQEQLTWYIAEMKADGSAMKILGQCSIMPQVKWSPNGKQILYHGYKPRDLYVMNADGSDAKSLASSVGVWNATWSPDGRQVVFISARDEDSPAGDVFIVGADGSGAKNLTNAPSVIQGLTWLK